ncbi:MAG: UMP kinase [bacterium]|jgi:uridylate kinase
MTYKRAVIKLSGESLQGDLEGGLSPEAIRHYASEIKSAIAAGCEASVVVGGGNILRGREFAGEDIGHTTADLMGMLATVINALALQSALEAINVPTRVMSGIEMPRVCEPYIHRRAVRHLEKGRVVIFAAGTGNPYFSTDTAAALRGLEIGAEVFIKGTRVDGIYDKDPEKHSDARRFERITYTEALELNLGVLDATAFALCRENNLPIVVFDITKSGNLAKLIAGDVSLGTLVSA